MKNPSSSVRRLNGNFTPPSRCSCFKSLLLGAGLLAALSARAQYGLPWHEAFPASYTNGGAVTVINGVGYPGTRLNDQTAVWSLGGGGGTGSPTNSGGAALTYPGFAASPGSVGLVLGPVTTTGNRTRGVLLSSTTTNSNPAISNTVYCSFLLNVQQAPASSPRQLAQLSALSSGTATTSCLGFWVDPLSNLIISKNSTTATSWATNNTGPLSAGTHLVVARYVFNTAVANDDEVDLWVDPSSALFGAAETSVPTPNASTTNGTDLASISSFYIFHPSSGFVSCSLFVDEIWVGTNWAQVTPAGVICNSATVNSDPTNITVAEGISASFLTTASGTTPTYQWQLSTNSGVTWNNATLGSGTNTPTYTTPPPVASDTGSQYRCIVRVDCNNSSATSAPATLTVSSPTITPVGVVMDDVFQDGSYGNTPITTANSLWLGSTLGSLDASSGTMLQGFPNSGASVLWLGFFTSDTNVPVHLDIWRMLKATLVFTANNIAANTNNGIRVGLYDYADGAARPVTDGSIGGGSGGQAVNVRGYMLSQDFDTVFPGAQPQTLYARNGLNDANLMGTTGDYASLGSGPARLSLAGAPGFVSGTEYTLDLSVTRTGPTSTRFTASITGGGTNYTTTAVDNTYAYHRFDAIALRPNNVETTASVFNFTEFKVQVIDATPVPLPLNIQLAGTNAILTWTNFTWALYSSTNLSGPYALVSGALSPFTNRTTGTKNFFRLVAN